MTRPRHQIQGSRGAPSFRVLCERVGFHCPQSAFSQLPRPAQSLVFLAFFATPSRPLRFKAVHLPGAPILFAFCAKGWDSTALNLPQLPTHIRPRQRPKIGADDEIPNIDTYLYRRPSI